MGFEPHDSSVGKEKVNKLGQNLWKKLLDNPDEKSIIVKNPQPSFPKKTERSRDQRRRYLTKLMVPFKHDDNVDREMKEEISNSLHVPHISDKESDEYNLQNIERDQKGKWPSLPGLFMEPAPPSSPPKIHLTNLQTRKCWSELKTKSSSKVKNLKKVTLDSVELLMDLTKLDEEQTSILRARSQDFYKPIAGKIVGCSESHSKMSLETFYLDDFGKMEGIKSKRKLLKEFSCMDISSPLFSSVKRKNTLKRSKSPAALKQNSFSAKRFFRRKMVKWHDNNVSFDSKEHSFATPAIEVKEEETEPKKTPVDNVQIYSKTTLDKEAPEERLSLSDHSTENVKSQPLQPQAPTMQSSEDATETTFSEEPLNESDYDVPSDHNKTTIRNGLPVTKTRLILVKQARLENRVGTHMFSLQSHISPPKP